MRVPLAVRTSDLPKRAASAVVMLAIAGAALWAGGMVLDLFIAAVALACFGEFARLVWRAAEKPLFRLIGLPAGSAYIGLAAWVLIRIDELAILALIVVSVICVDTFAYFFGRTLGGPKIAPMISPSKTWAGLLGGAVGATLAIALFVLTPVGGDDFVLGSIDGAFVLILLGTVVAICAQAGDFFESWLKRRAKMKDSSNLIPGHGGVFDRVDGLLPVALVFGSILLDPRAAAVGAAAI